MGDVVNLRQVRKARDRKAAADSAAQNRVLHGRTKAEKQAAKDEAERLARTLDGARRDEGEE